jgi:hypothetical protein
LSLPSPCDVLPRVLILINVMHEELENFEKTQVCTLVESLRDVNMIETKRVFKNKQGRIVRL